MALFPCSAGKFLGKYGFSRNHLIRALRAIGMDVKSLRGVVITQEIVEAIASVPEVALFWEWRLHPELPPPAFLRIQVASQTAGISRSSLFNRVQDGTITPANVGGLLAIPVSALTPENTRRKPRQRIARSDIEQAEELICQGASAKDLARLFNISMPSAFAIRRAVLMKTLAASNSSVGR